MVSHSLLRRLSATTETADNSNRLTTGQAIKQRLHRQQRELNQCKGQGEGIEIFFDTAEKKSFNATLAPALNALLVTSFSFEALTKERPVGCSFVKAFS